jgi:hypothetical protein
MNEFPFPDVLKELAESVFPDFRWEDKRTGQWDGSKKIVLRGEKILGPQSIKIFFTDPPEPTALALFSTREDKGGDEITMCNLSVTDDLQDFIGWLSLIKQEMG